MDILQGRKTEAPRKGNNLPLGSCVDFKQVCGSLVASALQRWSSAALPSNEYGPCYVTSDFSGAGPSAAPSYPEATCRREHREAESRARGAPAGELAKLPMIRAPGLWNT